MANSNYLRILVLILSITFLKINAQVLSQPQIDYIKKNAENIAVNANYLGGDWSSVAVKIKDKRIVLLGELNHGVKENFIVRNDLIKFLHEKAGFNVILFEAGIGEVFVVDTYKSKISPKMMTYSLMQQWQNEEFSDLFSYVKEKNISVGGFDIQRGFGGFFDKVLTDESAKKNIDTTLYKDLEKQFVSLKKELTNRKTSYESVSTKTNQTIEAYQKMYDLLKPKKDTEVISKELKFTLKTIENRINYLKYLLEFVNDKDWNKRWAARDFGMANNVAWLINEIYKDEKIIIVGHNFHISNHNEKEQVMGEFLRKNFADQMYSIGMFVGSGTYWQSGKENKLAPIDDKHLDIKHIIQMLGNRVHFMNIPANMSNSNEWLSKKIIVNDSFLDLSRSNELILSKWFDGMILIDKSTIPTKYE